MLESPGRLGSVLPPRVPPPQFVSNTPVLARSFDRTFCNSGASRITDEKQINCQLTAYPLSKEFV